MEDRDSFKNVFSTMHDAAQWYARNGFYVFPTKQDKSPYVMKGVRAATTDEKQIRRWWKKWPDANIGIACGPSGIFVLDFDSYKENYRGEELLSEQDYKTVTVKTGNGGTHLWYTMPEDVKITNSRGNLPDGVDVRGDGGYVLAPPSVNGGGKQYKFVHGLSILDVLIAEAPKKIIELITQPSKREKRIVESPYLVQDIGGDNGGEAPDLSKWNLSSTTIYSIVTPHKKAGMRSESDYAIVANLVKAGATDRDIFAVFRHYPTTGKYKEILSRNKKSADAYLARTIYSVRQDIAVYEKLPDDKLEVIRFARKWIYSVASARKMREVGMGRFNESVKIMDAILALCEERKTNRLNVTVRWLAEYVNLSHACVGKNLHRLAGGVNSLVWVSDAEGKSSRVVRHYKGLGWIVLSPTRVMNVIDITPILDYVSSLDQNDEDNNTDYISEDGIVIISELRDDDAFSRYPRSFAAKLRGVDRKELIDGFGHRGLMLIAFMKDKGKLDVSSIAKMIGIGYAATRNILVRMSDVGIFVKERFGKKMLYSLSENYMDAIEKSKQNMSTNGVLQLRKYRIEKSRLAFAGQRLRWSFKNELLKKIFMDAIDVCENRLAALAESLFTLGINPAVKVKKGAAKRQPILRTDLVEELRTSIWRSIELLKNKGYAVFYDKEKNFFSVPYLSTKYKDDEHLHGALLDATNKIRALMRKKQGFVLEQELSMMKCVLV